MSQARDESVGGKESASSCQFAFERIETRLSAEDALNRYRQHGYLWMHCPSIIGRNQGSRNARGPTKSNDAVQLLKEQYDKHAASYQKNWSVENAGDFSSDQSLNPEAVFSMIPKQQRDGRRFYVSTIIHKSNKEALTDLLDSCAKWDHTVSSSVGGNENEPAGVPPILRTTIHDGGAWLFLGRAGHTSNKRQRMDACTANSNDDNATKYTRTGAELTGRAEHVDDVTHSGTWHIQLSGCKTWIIRPNPKAADWEVGGATLPDLSLLPQAQRSSTTGNYRLVLSVQPGDLFILNTRSWYHQTKLEAPASSDEAAAVSVSLARDFYLPTPARHDYELNDIVLEEKDMPDGFDLPKDADEEVANCVMAEIGDDDDDEETEFVLIATRCIRKHDALILLSQVDEDDDDDSDSDSIVNDEECNGAEAIDPRAIAKTDFRKGQIVLEGEAIPEDLPRSLEPNCELVKDGDVCVRALCDIVRDDILCIATDEQDDDLEDYEVIEVDLANHTVVRDATRTS